MTLLLNYLQSQPIQFTIIIYQSCMESQARQLDLIEDIVIVALDPNTSLFQQQDRLILTSISVVENTQLPKQNQKMLEMSDGRYLKLRFNQKNLRPIIDIDSFQKNQGIWIPISIPTAYQIFEQHLHVKESKNWLFEKLIGNVTIIRGGAQCSFCRQIEKIRNKIVKIPYTEDYLVVEFHQVKSITSFEFKPIIIQQHPYNKKKQYLFNIPLFSFPSGINLSKTLEPYKIHTFILTQQQGTKLYCTCLIAMNQFEQYKNYMHNQLLYQPKGYVIVSKHQHTDCFIQFLEHLYVELTTKDISLSKLAKKTWQQFSYYELNCQALTIQYPSVSEKPLGCLFRMLSVNNIVKIFKALLLQKSIFFVSSSKTILGFIIESFLCLLYPLNWQHPIISIFLNQISEDFLDSPIPIIIGILTDSFQQNFEQFGLIVDVDKNELKNTKIIDNFIGLEDRILQRKLQKYSIYFPNAAEQFFISEQNPSYFRKSNIQQKFNIAHLRNIFLKYMQQEVLKDYRQFIITEQIIQKDRLSLQTRPSSLQTRPSNTKTFREMFNMKEYRTKIKVDGKQYLQQFIETALFTTFIERNCNNPQDPQLSFFNSSISCKDKKKYQIGTKKTIAEQTIETATYRLFRNTKVKFRQIKRVRSTQHLHSKVQVTERISDYLFKQNRTRLFSNENIINGSKSEDEDAKVNQMIMKSRKTRNQKFKETIIDFDESCVSSVDENFQEKYSLQDYVLVDYAPEQQNKFGANLCNAVHKLTSCIVVSGSNMIQWAKKSYKKFGEKKKLGSVDQALTESFVQQQ